MSFQLYGEYALWRQPGDALGSYSSPGPSPSHIAGLLGAAMGMANQSTQYRPERIPWNTSEGLLDWEAENDYHVACRLLTEARRVAYNVNGLKGVKNEEWTNLRMNQFPVERPRYEVVVGIGNSAGAEKLLEKLKRPVFRTYLGVSEFRAFVRSPRIVNLEDLAADGWAQWSAKETGDYALCTFHDTTRRKRIVRDGYWIYSQDGGHPEMIKGYR